MTQEQIIEGNKLIAEFHGWECCGYTGAENEPVYHSAPTLIGKLSHLRLTSMEYHTSWDWLMPVLEKIERTNWGWDVRIESQVHDRMMEPIQFNYVCKIIDRYQLGHVESAISFSSKIEAVYHAVVLFIKWKNSFYATRTKQPDTDSMLDGVLES